MRSVSKQEQCWLYLIIIIIIINLTADGLSPGGSGYYACT